MGVVAALALSKSRGPDRARLLVGLLAWTTCPRLPNAALEVCLRQRSWVWLRSHLRRSLRAPRHETKVACRDDLSGTLPARPGSQWGRDGCDRMRTLITEALLIDATGAPAKPATTIEVVDGRIARIGRREEFGVTLPAADEVIEARGRAVVPGLINAHEHIAWRNTKGTLAERVGVPSEILQLKGAAHCLVSLVEGVTTIRDLAGKGTSSLMLKKAVADGLVVGPRIFTCGQALTMTGGHASDTVGRVVDGADNMRQAARDLLMGGADLIKCMASGEAGTADRDLPTSPQYTVEELRAAFNEAKDQGKRTTVHCISPAGMRRATEAGVEASSMAICST